MKKTRTKIIENRKARYNFEIVEKVEAGIVLNGHEIKSIREGGLALDNAYAREKDGEIWIFNLYIDLKNYKNNPQDIDNTRPKKLLLKKKEIKKISLKAKNNGFTLIPINIHFNGQGFAKIELGISKGRKKSDLREYKKQQDWKREKERLAKKT